jgi:hypothetical protein
MDIQQRGTERGRSSPNKGNDDGGPKSDEVSGAPAAEVDKMEPGGGEEVARCFGLVCFTRTKEGRREGAQWHFGWGDSSANG